MGLVVYPQQFPDEVLLAKTPEPTVPQQLPSQRQGVHTARDRRLKLTSQVQLVESPSQQGAVKTSDVMADEEGAAEHFKERDEGDRDLFEGVGEDEPVVQVQPLSADSEACDPSRSSLDATVGDDVEVERVASAHGGQLDYLTIVTWRKGTMWR